MATPTVDDLQALLASLNQLMIVTGILVAYIANSALAGAEAWRWMLGLAVVPSLLFLPTAPSASQTHAYLTARTKSLRTTLSTLAISSLTLAYLFSPRRAKHPYHE